MMEPGTFIEDRYELIESLGSGGMATVFKALDRRLERPVAIKLLGPAFSEDPEFLVRFFAEAQAVAKLTHPNVVSVLDFGQTEDRPFLVMEYMSGGTLSGIGPMDQQEAMRLVGQLALGAGAAHELGIIHRDIKAANALLDEDDNAKLADFGIAISAASERLTATGRTIGSPHYISPEQLMARGTDPRSDVYSLGVVLYELLTGRPPFEGDNVTAVAIAHVEREPQPPSALVGEIDPALDHLVMSCLAKDPAARPADGNELAAALNRLPEDQATPATFAPAFDSHDQNDEPVAATSKRGRRALVGAGIVVVLSMAILSASALVDSGEKAPVSTLGAEPRASGLAMPAENKAEAEAAPLPEVSASPSATPSPDEDEREPNASANRDFTARDSAPDPEPVEESEPEPEEEPAPESSPTPEPSASPEAEPSPEPSSSP